jgi:hypothetical protein
LFYKVGQAVVNISFVSARHLKEVY